MRFRNPASWISLPSNKPALRRCSILEGDAELCQAPLPEFPFFDVLPDLDFVAGQLFSFSLSSDSSLSIFSSLCLTISSFSLSKLSRTRILLSFPRSLWVVSFKSFSCGRPRSAP